MSQSFADLGVSSAVVDALAKRGCASPFAIQRLVVPDVLAGRDVLAKSPTGSGKTLAFGVPVVDRIEATDRRPSALILAPTRELASQIVDELRDVAHARALSIAAAYGGVGIVKQAKECARCHVLVATPGRLEDLLQRGSLTLSNVKILVLDEADRMLDMGFRPAVDRIVRRTPAERQTLFFSATLDGEVGRLAQAYTHEAREHEHVPAESRRADIEHRFVSVAHEAKLDALVRELRHAERGLALVFVRTKRGADRLVKRLKARDVHAVAMHGNKTQSQREKALAKFEAWEVDTLVATDVAARGIDVDGITHVINFDAPDDSDSYVHRIGRTGRAGKTGIGVTFVLADQARDMAKIAQGLQLGREFESAGFRTDATRPAHSGGGRGQGGGGRGQNAGARHGGRGQSTGRGRGGDGSRSQSTGRGRGEGAGRSQRNAGERASGGPKAGRGQGAGRAQTADRGESGGRGRSGDRGQSTGGGSRPPRSRQRSRRSPAR